MKGLNLTKGWKSHLRAKCSSQRYPFEISVTIFENQLDVLYILSFLNKMLTILIFFYYYGFLSQTLTIQRTVREEWGAIFAPSANSTRSRTFRHLFATSHERLLPLIFTRWDLPPYWITIWVVDDRMLISVLCTWWFNSRLFTATNWHGKQVDLNSHQPSPLYYKQTNYQSALVILILLRMSRLSGSGEGKELISSFLFWWAEPKYNF